MSPLRLLSLASALPLLLSACTQKPFMEGPSKKFATISAVIEGEKAPQETMFATFAGGCFWCMEPAYEGHEGVIDVVSGYSGGTEETATYSKVARGNTKHRESVQVTYDPKKVRYDELLNIFWRKINPTDNGGQFSDRGFQYTTAIFYHDEEQKEQAEASKKSLAKSGKFEEPIVTEALPFSSFYKAEEYHQNFYKKSAEHYAQYKKGSGREDFIEENWARAATLEHDDSHTINPYAITEEEKEKRRSKLDPLSYRVIVEEGTEKPFENEYNDNTAEGIYVDKISVEPLFSSTHKYDSKTGWPSFDRPLVPEHIVDHEDRRLFTVRTEIRSKFGDSHLGHVFTDGPKETTGLRYCMNSAALRFIAKEKLEEEGYKEFLELFGL
jgi:peptide methionine sulfoxide reductase msrA/msrB